MTAPTVTTAPHTHRDAKAIESTPKAGDWLSSAITALGDLASESDETAAAATSLLTSLQDPAGSVTTRAAGGGPSKKAIFKTGTASVTPPPTVKGGYVRPNGETYHDRVFKIAQHDGTTLEVQDIELMRKARDLKKSVLMYGDPGTGKTALAEAAHWREDEMGDAGKVFTVSFTPEMEPASLWGSFVPRPGRDPDWEHGPLTLAMMYGATFFGDEVALGHPATLAVLYSAMDGRGELRITDNPDLPPIKAKPGFHVVAACNPDAPGARMSEALVSRFGLQFEVTTDWALARKLGANTKFVSAAQNLTKKKASGSVGWAPQMRECLDFRDNETMLGTEFALSAAVAAAPAIDRPTVADVLTRTFGTVSVTPLKL